MRAIAAILLALTATPSAAQDMTDIQGGPQTRLDRALDVAAMQACVRTDATRIYEARETRFRRVMRRATSVLGREPRLTTTSGSCEQFDAPRFTSSVAQFDRYLGQAARMIRRREMH
jgi:hypothetical protein